MYNSTYHDPRSDLKMSKLPKPHFEIVLLASLFLSEGLKANCDLSKGLYSIYSIKSYIMHVDFFYILHKNMTIDVIFLL